jgi:recombination protein RecA
MMINQKLKSILGVSTQTNISVISTGSFGLDKTLSIGGIPRGRITEISGPSDSGKSTIALHIVAEAQKRSGIAVYVDVDRDLSLRYAEGIGVNLDSLYAIFPDCTENIITYIETLAKTNMVDVIIIDSVGSIISRLEHENKMLANYQFAQQNLFNNLLQQTANAISGTKTAVLFVNQFRNKLKPGQRAKRTTIGNIAFSQYATVRLEVCKVGGIKRGHFYVGDRLKVKVIQNKLDFVAGAETEFDSFYGFGINKELEIADLAIEQGLIIRKGAWYSYEDTIIGQGKERVAECLKENAGLLSELRRQIV